jgi:hypothetical protein
MDCETARGDDAAGSSSNDDDDGSRSGAEGEEVSLGRAVLVVTAVYLVTGLVYVRHKLAETNPMRVLPLVVQYRANGGASRLLALAISWLLVAIINREFSWPIYATFAAIGLYWSSRG